MHKSGMYWWRCIIDTTSYKKTTKRIFVTNEIVKNKEALMVTRTVRAFRLYQVSALV